MKKLYLSSNAILGGVLAGIAEYFAIDPTVMRLAYLVLVIITGIFPGIILYIIAYIIIPDRPETVENTTYTAPKTSEPPVDEEENDESSFPMTMKKPEWPVINIPEIPTQTEPEVEDPTFGEDAETATLDDLFEDREDEVGLDDLLDE